MHFTSAQLPHGNVANGVYCRCGENNSFDKFKVYTELFALSLCKFLVLVVPVSHQPPIQIFNLDT